MQTRLDTRSKGWGRRGFIMRGGAAVGAAALAACGEATAPPAAQAPSDVAGSMEILWPTDQRTVPFIEQQWIPAFRREYPKVDVSLTTVGGGWDGLYEKIIVTNAGGTPPTIARGKEYFAGDLGYAGILEPLTTWMKGQKEVTADQYYPAVWGNVLWQGQPVAQPLYIFVRPLYHNVGLFREAGLLDRSGKVPAPKTWKEYADLARKLTVPSKNQWGTQIIYYGPGEDGTSAWMQYLQQSGGSYVNPERTKYTFNSPAGIEALQFVVDLIWKDRACRPPDVQVPEGVRKLGMWNAVGDGNYNNYPKNMPELEYGLALVPRNKSHSVVVRGQNIYLMKHNAAKAAGWRFLQFAGRDDNSHAFTQTISLGPVKKANFEKEPYASNPEWKVNMDQIRVKENTYQPFFPGYVEGAQAVGEEIFGAYGGKKTPKDALADAERRATLLLKT
ncbi:MAG: extracellular solute-binding protein [Chloroflexi bacterium]|nr:extracellular solute-binding protein [Chloroflexota bacterium]